MAGQSLMPVDEALRHLLADVAPCAEELVAIDAAHHRVLSRELVSRITQPPFDASAMDGYAVRSGDLAAGTSPLRIVGEAAAGHAFDGTLAAGEAARIFTGAPLPAGADAVAIQEDCDRDGANLKVRTMVAAGANIRRRGGDIRENETRLPAGRRLGGRDLMLVAAMGHAVVPVRRRPRIAILATGDELVLPGEPMRPDQIISSIPFGLAALLHEAGAETMSLGIAGDSLDSLDQHIARAAGMDVLVTIGGASVGDHDLVQRALTARGLDLAFWKIAMRPGKPLMYGRLGQQRVVGLPGNPVSATLCALVFVVPLVKALLAEAGATRPHATLPLAATVEANGPRQHYMRATITLETNGARTLMPHPNQDSSLVSVLSSADALIVRPPHCDASEVGTLVPYIPLSS